MLTKLQILSQTEQGKKKKKNAQITKIMNEKDSTTGHTETEKIIKQHNEQLYAKKVDIQMKWTHIQKDINDQNQIKKKCKN